ncbi:MAG: hypothetical protein KDC87_05150 [Planctomycetes bacterium]|nr:hypothetical protein [Planctomycetota bacterium]MCB9869663.1 hypothetical protein [Planctomycetota bacterium]
MTRFPVLALSILLAGPSILACTKRPRTSPPRPPITVVCITPNVYRIYIGGYLSVGGNQATFCACGLGLPVSQNAITGVVAASILDNATGEPLQFANNTPVFPFQPNATSTSAIQAIMGTTVTASGFLASVGASSTLPIPKNVCVTFCFEITTNPNAPQGAVLQALSSAQIFGDEANPNGAPKGSHPTLVTASGASPGCIMYYKFDRGFGTEEINYEGTSGGAPATGTMIKGTTPASSWVGTRPGFGLAMQGSTPSNATSFNYCDTGWKGGITGEMTVAWWCKERQPAGTLANYLWGGFSGGFRCFTGGVAGAGLYVRSTPGDIILPATSNFTTLAQRAQGVCVAVVVSNSATAGVQAQWYLDGVASGSPITLTSFAVATSTSNFTIGRHLSDSTASAFDIDEFKLCNYAATPLEIRQWCAATWAAWGSLGRPWGLWHGCVNGPPRLGNANYGLTIEGDPNSLALLVLGFKPIPPFDIGRWFGQSRCLWYTGFDYQTLAVLNAQGELLLPLAIPNQQTLVGLSIDSQVLGRSPASTVVDISNMNSTKIELN